MNIHSAGPEFEQHSNGRSILISQYKRPLIEGILVLLISATLTPLGVYWLSEDPGMLLLMTYYPWNVPGFLLGPAAIAAIIGFAVSRFVGNRGTFWTIFRPAFYVCWTIGAIHFLVIMTMS